jgi:hypothetical protein
MIFPYFFVQSGAVTTCITPEESNLFLLGNVIYEEIKNIGLATSDIFEGDGLISSGTFNTELFLSFQPNHHFF